MIYNHFLTHDAYLRNDNIMENYSHLKNTADYMREIRSILKAPRLQELIGVKKEQLARYCKDPDYDAGRNSCPDPFQRVIAMNSEIRSKGYADLEFVILSTLVAPAGYKLIPVTPGECTKKASTLEACLEAHQALVDMGRAMIANDSVGSVAALAENIHKAVDHVFSKWMKAKADKEISPRAALSKVYEKGSEYDEDE